MVFASVAGLFVTGIYPDGPWAREALRGGTWRRSCWRCRCYSAG